MSHVHVLYIKVTVIRRIQGVALIIIVQLCRTCKNRTQESHPQVVYNCIAPSSIVQMSRTYKYCTNESHLQVLYK